MKEHQFALNQQLRDLVRERSDSDRDGRKGLRGHAVFPLTIRDDDRDREIKALRTQVKVHAKLVTRHSRVTS